MKQFALLIVVWIVISRSLAYTATEMYDRTNLWYGSESNFDEVWTGIMASLQPPSNVLMEIRAYQATNQIPVLAEVMASNRSYAISRGLDPNVITWSKAEARSLDTPPLLEEGESYDHQRGRHLMALMGVPHGEEMAICSNWTMPTNIVVGGTSYTFTTDDSSYFHVVASTNAMKSLAKGYLERCPNGREARIHAFAQRMFLISGGTTVSHALSLSVRNLDSSTNMMFLCSTRGIPDIRDVLIYNNLVLHMCAETNTVNAAAFAAEIINAGLPESERIVVTQ